VTAVTGDLYIAAVSSKAYRNTLSVSGLGLVWTELADQCGGRNQTGMSLWWARGTPGASGPVTATLASAPETAVIAVSRYAGARAVGPLGTPVSANTLGVSGACTGGVDAASYSFPLTITSANGLVHSAVAIRQRTHTPGAGYTERVEVVQGTSGAASGVAAMDQVYPATGGATVNGSMSGTVDWAAAAVELRP
jgi:hypothetical protein